MVCSNQTYALDMLNHRFYGSVFVFFSEPVGRQRVTNTRNFRVFPAAVFFFKTSQGIGQKSVKTNFAEC